MNQFMESDFPTLFYQLNRRFLDDQCPRVHVNHWQGINVVKAPEMRSHELLNVTMTVPLNAVDDLRYWQQQIQPNLPWADDHFAERVCGEPLNPAPSYKGWPWASAAEKAVDDHGRFNHTYPERLWPRFAGMTDKGELAETKFDPRIHDRGEGCHRGIRWDYGDLDDLVVLLIKDPLTRQAWIPLFFPEDTGVGDGGRKPCTLGYQFIIRNDRLHIYYPLRSCDYIRHFRDDIYLAIRLALWVLNECRTRADDREERAYWDQVSLGTYTMHATSLHVFANDMIKLREEAHGKQSSEA